MCNVVLVPLVICVWRCGDLRENKEEEKEFPGFSESHSYPASEAEYQGV